MPRSRPPRNVFTPRVLGLLQDGNEPGWVFGADTQAVWRVVPLERGFGVFREWERPDTHVPRALCASPELAHLIAVLLPAEGQEPQFRFLERRADGRFPVACGGETVMELDCFDEQLLTFLEVSRFYARTPPALATLIQASGPQAMLLAGERLYREMFGRGTR